jgi:hypothetical protein
MMNDKDCILVDQHQVTTCNDTMVDDHIQDSINEEEIEIVFFVEVDKPNIMAFHKDDYNWRSDFDTNKSATGVTSQSIVNDVLVHGHGHLRSFPFGGEPTFNGSCIKTLKFLHYSDTETYMEGFDPTSMNGSPSIKQQMTANDMKELNTRTFGEEFEEVHQIKQCITCSCEVNAVGPEATQPLSDPLLKSAMIPTNDPTLQITVINWKAKRWRLTQYWKFIDVWSTVSFD